MLKTILPLTLLLAAVLIIGVLEGHDMAQCNKLPTQAQINYCLTSHGF